MISVSSVFQQYVNEYIESEPGSTNEESFFTKIEETYGVVIAVDSALINGYYMSAFIDELKKRNNPAHIERYEAMLSNIEEIKDQCIAISYYKSNCDNIFGMRDEIKKLRTSFPVHISRCIGTSSLINPYEEFEMWSIDKYYDKFKHRAMTCAEFGDLSVEDRIKILTEEFSEYEDIHFVVIDNDTEKQKEIAVVKGTGIDAEELMIIATSPSPYVVRDSSYGESRTTLHVDFRKSTYFDYLFDSDANIKNDDDPQASNSGQEYMINDVPGTTSEICFMLCLMEGFINFSDYKRLHKKNTIAMNGIAKYIERKFDFGGYTRVTYGYDYAYIVYTKELKYDKETTKAARISYESYVDEIDKFIEEIL